MGELMSDYGPMIKVRFLPVGPEGFGPGQDHEMSVVPRVGDRVEFSTPDGTPVAFEVTEVTWVLHDVIPADVVVTVSS
jgi:hypothetical protein